MCIENNSARQLYEDIARHTCTVGAYMFATPEDNKKFEFDKRSREISDSCEHAKSKHLLQNDQGMLLFYAPSPWHAVIHLLANNRGWLAGNVLSGIPTCLLYRGQRDCRWGLVPSIDRDPDGAVEERRTLAVFLQLLEMFFTSFLQKMTDVVSPSLHVFSDGPRLPDLNGVGIAQHFGIRTDLLDFTTDPSVAVWFACQGASEGNKELASVFALPFATGRRLGIRTDLPHAYIRRLYRQRGVFVKSGSAFALRQLCVEIRFPPDTAFEVLRDEFKRPELLPVDEWWLLLTAVANRIVLDKKEAKLLEFKSRYQGQKGWELFNFILDNYELPREIEELLFSPPFLYMDAKQAQLAESANELLQMLLCMTTALKDNATPQIISTAVTHCVATSGLTLAGLLPLIQKLLSRMPSKFVLRIVAEEMLSAFFNELKIQGYPMLNKGWGPVF